MSIKDEQNDGMALAEAGVQMSRIGTAIVRDTWLTRAETEARQQAMVECWDKEQS